MSRLTDEELLEIWNSNQCTSDDLPLLRAVADAAVAADRAQRGEAVAWRFKEDPYDMRSAWLYASKKTHVPRCKTVQPLYTHPPHNEDKLEMVVSDDTIDAVSMALRQAWQLGQTYWQQADHEFASYHRKADETQAKFDALVDETRAMLAAAQTNKEPK